MKTVKIDNNGISLLGILNVPADAVGIVLFAHGSGSGRLSPRNQFVARQLQEGKIATLLMDLLTAEEEREDEFTRQFRFDIPMLASRLTGVTDWVKKNESVKHLPIGYFGASTGAAAALISSVERVNDIKAVVSRGGRPDLAGEYLAKVIAPTLLIVGGDDGVVIELNERCLPLLKGEKKLEIVPHATHLFEEPGTLEEVSVLAKNWFLRYFS